MQLHTSTVFIALAHLVFPYADAAQQVPVEGSTLGAVASLQQHTGEVTEHSKTVTVDELAKVAAAAASATAQVAAALSAENIPPGVRDAALKAAEAAAVKAALGDSSAAIVVQDQQALEAHRAPDVSAQEQAAAAEKTKTAIEHEAPAGSGGFAGSLLRREVEPSLHTHPDMPHDQSTTITQQSRSSGQSAQAIPTAPKSNASQVATVEKLLYVGIFSEPRDFARREATRRGWMTALQRDYPGGNEVLAQFVLGRRPVKALAKHDGRHSSSFIQLSETKHLGSDPVPRSGDLTNPWAAPTEMPRMPTEAPEVDPAEVQLDVQLGKEFASKADMLHIPYEDLPIRVLMFFAHAVETNYRFIMKVDVDSDFMYNPVLQALRPQIPGSLFYAGEHLQSDERDGKIPSDKPVYNMEGQLDIPHASSKRYFSGPCYLTSHALAQRIGKTHLDHSLMLWSYNSDGRVLKGSPATMGGRVDDMDMGQWVAWEDQLLLGRDKERAEANPSIPRVEYSTMNLCRHPAEAATVSRR